MDSVDPLGLDRCRFNIGIADNAGLSTEHLAEIEARIDQIFSATDDNGDSVGATFDPKQKADYTLHFDSGPHGDDGYYIFGVYPPTVYTDSITRDYGADNFGIAAGTVGAHELFHNITHTKDQPYDIGLDNRNLMTSDSANDQGVNSVPDEINPEVTGFAKLTSDQIRQLFRKCLAKHPKRGNGGGAGSGPKKDVPGDAGVGGPLSGDASEGDPCPNGDCGPGSGWDPDADPPTLHQRP